MNRIIKTAFCFILCAFLLAGCHFDISGINKAVDAVKPNDVRGEIKEVTVVSANNVKAKSLDFENISFTNTPKAAIKIVPSEETKVVARYPAAMDDYGFKIEVKGEDIDISLPKQRNFVADEFEITVYANIEDIDISGGISVEMDASRSKVLSFDITGGADIYAYNIDAAGVEIDVDGAASMDLSGKTERFEMELNGAGSIDAKSLVCKNAEVEISGAGSAEISVTDRLLADIDGVGALEYYGDPLVENISGGLTDVEQASKTVYGG